MPNVRLGARQDKGTGTESLRTSGTEPEALAQRPKRGQGYFGIDPGLKDFAATSDARIIGLARHYRKLDAKLAKAQRACKKARVRARHAKIKNSRNDSLRKLSTALVKEYGAIFIGNVNASALAKTRITKSVLDAG
ncbi:MAG TPA: transposase [Paraburkholderia sp.]|uniref:transposase n=1 Tax=Paraburkholderia sp. TaxID=1926495 RepID=UPI002B47FF3D|nr:transposase [Paraburkholderia sp.]HKR41633.1 transposase [Paraburkholderia sp.]